MAANRQYRITQRVPLAIVVIVAAIIVLGAVDAWAGRRSFATADGTAYVNMAAAIASGHLTAWINGIWSPVYPLVLALALSAAAPAAPAEFTAVRITNFGIFLLTMASFGWFLRNFLETRMAKPACLEPNSEALGRDAMLVVGWASFARLAARRSGGVSRWTRRC
jgi:hypothetical protein